MPVLEMRGISKNFGAIQALQDVDFDIGTGEVVGLMGDNGAGKSTLVKICAGNYPPSAGDIVLEGENVHFHRPLDARESGIEIVYQDLALCDNLTAAANVFLGREAKKSIGPLRFLDHGAMYARAAKLFGELKSETRPRDVVRQMSGGQRQAVAIARTRLSDPKIVLMDEPTAAISVRQVAEVLDLIRRLRDTDHAVVLISHRNAYRQAVAPYKERMDSGDLWIIVADTLPMQMAQLKDGLSHGQVGQRPYEMGYRGMFILRDLVKGMAVDDPIYTGLDVCTQDNADTCLAQ